MRNGELLSTLSGHTESVRSVAFAPDGYTLASGSDDQTIKLWRAHNGELIRTLRGHTEPVRSVAFAPDGYTLVSGSDDETIRLWDVRSGEFTYHLEQHDLGVNAVVFAPYRQITVSIGRDSDLDIWRVPLRERAWNRFVTDYRAGQAGLPELEWLQSIYPEFQQQYQLLNDYTKTQ